MVYFANHGGPDSTPFTVQVSGKGQTNYFTHDIGYSLRQEKNSICNIQYDPADPDSGKKAAISESRPSPAEFLTCASSPEHDQWRSGPKHCGNCRGLFNPGGGERLGNRKPVRWQ